MEILCSHKTRATYEEHSLYIFIPSNNRA
uniref:Uncharacterized protein n=1 Tax=Rhizophora mucronata TaxID=61149 RepID=A0A2P2KG25_RHIMU